MGENWANRANRANMANGADRVDMANRANRAYGADKADRANRANGANGTDRVDMANRANGTDRVDMADMADMANGADGATWRGAGGGAGWCGAGAKVGGGVRGVVMELHGGGPQERDAGVVNMREVGGVLVAAGLPKRVTNSMPGVLLACVKEQNVYLNGRNVYSGGELLGVLPARFRCSVVRRNMLIIMT